MPLPDGPNWLRISLAGTGLLAWLLVFVRIYRMYWDTGRFARRERIRREHQKRRGVLILVGSATLLVALWLGLFVDALIALAFTAISALVIMLVFSAYGHGGGGSSEFPSRWLG